MMGIPYWIVCVGAIALGIVIAESGKPPRPHGPLSLPPTVHYELSCDTVQGANIDVWKDCVEILK